ncbi:MAG: Rid family hydrolase [Daejeonella sp.]|uniref:Rid family hydrolase n=1 Tax=Daejeonella sp. TaxID=2805397 RepID=UPI0027358207|nr:Rid family hydrolase [Daejeonella sp.]MDP3469931.1 Rid family hydrolase [Daejeonella sp.]
MRTLICIYFLFLGTYVFAQKGQHIQYSGTSSLLGSSDAVIVDDVPLVHTTQFLPLDKSGNIVGSGDINAQISQIFSNISSALKKADSNLKMVVKLNVYLRNSNQITVVQAHINKRFKTGKKPALSFVAGDLSHPDILVSMDAVAVAGKMRPESVNYYMPEDLSSDQGTARAAILPAGPVVYVSGQAIKGELAEATRGTLEQLQATLLSIGLDKKDIVQIKSFIRPMSDLKIVEQEFAKFFKGATIPPLVNVEWTSTDPVIEIELIASSVNAATKSNQQLDFITPPGMTASPVYCKVTRINYGQKIFISGLYGQITGNADSDLTSIFTSMGTILKNTGSDFRHLVKATYYVSNDVHSAKLNEIRPKYYDPLRPPAASKAMVKDVGFPHAGISIDMIGVVIR